MTHVGQKLRLGFITDLRLQCGCLEFDFVPLSS